MVCCGPKHAAVTFFLNGTLYDGRILRTLHVKQNSSKHSMSKVYGGCVRNELTLLSARLTRGELRVIFVCVCILL